jgi:nucleoside-diphosphate-sugar epimerase
LISKCVGREEAQKTRKKKREDIECHALRCSDKHVFLFVSSATFRGKLLRGFSLPATRIIIGVGYLGGRAIKLWREAGEYSIASTRRDHPTLEWVAAGPNWCCKADVTRPETLDWLTRPPAFGGTPAESLLYSVGFDRTADADIHTVYAEGLRNVLAVLSPRVTRAIYISTTGVYGTAGGGWVDEATPTDPQRDGGKA